MSTVCRYHETEFELAVDAFAADIESLSVEQIIAALDAAKRGDGIAEWPCAECARAAVALSAAVSHAAEPLLRALGPWGAHMLMDEHGR